VKRGGGGGGKKNAGGDGKVKNARIFASDTKGKAMIQEAMTYRWWRPFFQESE
jgi:hypothetical protein